METNLKALMDSAFKYQIGDLVIPRSILEHWRSETELNRGVPLTSYDRSAAPQGDLVVGRWLEECHGGVQKHYRLRRYLREGSSIVEAWAELEIAPLAEVMEIARAVAATRKPER